MQRSALVAVSLILIACREANPRSCDLPANAGIDGCPGEPMSGSKCTTSDDCVEPFPACDTGESRCFQCTAVEHAWCPRTSPRCEDNECVGCVDDGDCDGGAGVCLLAGGCAEPSAIMHTAPNGSNMNDCGAVGKECSLPKALQLAAADRNVIKLDDSATAYSSNGFMANSNGNMFELVLAARNATVTRSDDGAILRVMGNTKLTVLGGTFRDARGDEGDGVRCDNNATLTMADTTITMNAQSGIEASCDLTLTGVQVTRNNQDPDELVPGINISNGSITMSRSQVISNRGGGLTNTQARFVIVGNVFMDNGTDQSGFGGVFIMSQKADSRFEFNTITKNRAQMLAPPGLNCTATVAFAARNNIIWGNNPTLGLAAEQVAGPCAHSFSSIGPQGEPGDGNISGDPLFAPGALEFHLANNSPLRGKASDTADLAGIAERDIDGDRRIKPADIGADQQMVP